MNDQDREDSLIAEKMMAGWVVAHEGTGPLAFAMMREPKTHMGGWCLDIQTTHDEVTLVFEKSQIRLLAMQILATL